MHDKVEAITKVPSPTNVSELAQVLPEFDQLQSELSAKFVTLPRSFSTLATYKHTLDSLRNYWSIMLTKKKDFSL